MNLTEYIISILSDIETIGLIIMGLSFVGALLIYNFEKHENHSKLKGIIYAILLFIVMFWLGFSLFNGEFPLW